LLSFIGPPLVALFSASSTGRGNVAKAVGRVGAAGRLVVDGSFELQLDTPNAASNPSEITVHATRSGVQNLSLLFSLLSDIVNTSLLLAESERIQNHRHLTLRAHVLD
jgi:hypothetical protein